MKTTFLLTVYIENELAFEQKTDVLNSDILKNVFESTVETIQIISDQAISSEDSQLIYDAIENGTSIAVNINETIIAKIN